jgi:hypothetical protein
MPVRLGREPVVTDDAGHHEHDRRRQLQPIGAAASFLLLFLFVHRVSVSES